MKKCEWCGNEFDLSEAEDEFESGHPGLSYKNIRKCLCGSCAIDAINDMVDGIYFERCEKCGKKFDYIVDSSEFERYNSLSLIDFWEDQILCCDCALKEAESE